MIVITTVAELDALPVGTEIRDRDDWTWTKGNSGAWVPSPQERMSNAKRVLQLWSPLTRDIEDARPELHMTKCVYDACASTHPLPPGSTWACPQHGDQHHNITLGRD